MRLSIWTCLCTISLVLSTACATYRDDLDRAVNHYHAREYEKALVLFDVLEYDLDSLSAQERAQYCFYRGMSHYLLEQRANARHWLGRASAREKSYGGALNPEEAKKASTALDDLNLDRWGDASTPAASKACRADTDCTEGQFCDNDVCTDAPGKPAEPDPTSSGEAAPKKKPDGGCATDADCPGTEICEAQKCKAP